VYYQESWKRGRPVVISEVRLPQVCDQYLKIICEGFDSKDLDGLKHKRKLLKPKVQIGINSGSTGYKFISF